MAEGEAISGAAQRRIDLYLKGACRSHPDREFVVAGSRLSADARQRPAQAAILATVLSDVDTPLVLGVDLGADAGGPAARRLSERLSILDTGAGQAAVFVDRMRPLEAGVIDTPLAQRASRYPATVVTLGLPV